MMQAIITLLILTQSILLCDNAVFIFGRWILEKLGSNIIRFCNKIYQAVGIYIYHIFNNITIKQIFMLFCLLKCQITEVTWLTNEQTNKMEFTFQRKSNSCLSLCYLTGRAKSRSYNHSRMHQSINPSWAGIVGAFISFIDVSDLPLCLCQDMPVFREVSQKKIWHNRESLK